MRDLLMLAIGFLPSSRFKLWVMRRLGHTVGEGARFAPNLVLGVKRIDLAPGANVRALNVLRSLTTFHVGEGSTVGHFNWISAAEELAGRAEGHGVFHLGDHGAILHRHYIDCSGGVHVGDFSGLGGIRSVILTHELDWTTGLQKVAGVRIGTYSVLNGNSCMVAGSVLPDRSITALGTVVPRGLELTGHLYAGVPAKAMRPIDGAWFHRTVQSLEHDRG